MHLYSCVVPILSIGTTIPKRRVTMVFCFDDETDLVVVDVDVVDLDVVVVVVSDDLYSHFYG